VYRTSFALLGAIGRQLTLSGLLILLVSPVSIHAAPLTFDSAWELAQQNNPDLKRMSANRSSVSGEIQDAKAPLYNNPVVSFDGRRRTIYEAGRSDPQRSEWGAGVSQTFEIAGQQGLRRQAADNKLAAYELDVAEAYRAVHAQLESQFSNVLVIQKRIEVENRTLHLIDQNTALSRKRVDAGEDSKLDGNLAVVDAERARNQLAALSEQLIRARNQLAATLQMRENELPEVVGEINPPNRQYTLTDLMQTLESRPAIKSLAFRENSARNNLDLQRSLRYPDLTVSLNNSREAGVAGDDNITSVGVSIPIPLFRRNGAGIGRATTELTQTEIDRSAFTRDTKAAVQAAWLRRENLKERVERLNREVYPKLEENLNLSMLAFENGEIALSQLLIVQRQAIDAQRDIIDAQSELRLVQIELEYNAGWPSVQPAATSN